MKVHGKIYSKFALDLAVMPHLHDYSAEFYRIIGVRKYLNIICYGHGQAR